ncbi:MAG TPA: hypothetical protein DDW50_18655 [Firmicutes bacterium]|jgi:multiple sugar transport system substrate-binding protein|nr:hypothetical protein [Bacillota bacterium]
MYRKWVLFFILAVIMMILVLPVMSAASDVTTIQYAFWGNPASLGVESDIIAEFEKAYPHIKVEPIAVGYNDYHTKLLTLIAGGQAPDVMRLDSFYFADFMRVKALKDITKLVKRDHINVKAYYQAGLVDSMYKGRYYGLPWSTAPYYMVINLKMFKDAGIAVPQNDWKWNDFIKISKALTKGKGIERQYGFADDFQMFHLLPWIWGEGGDIFDKSRTKFTLNNKAAVNRIQQLADLCKQDVFPDPAQFPTAEVLNRWMVNNKVAMRIGSALELISLQNVKDFEFEVLPFPGGSVSASTTIFKSNTVGISASTKKAEAAWTFLKFLRAPGTRGEVLYMQARRMPPTVDNPELWKIFADPTKSPRKIAEVTQVCASKYGHALPLRTGWLEIQGLLNPEIQMVFAGQKSASEAMKEIAPKVNEVMERTEKQ